jgi:hypothetical protein
MPTKQDWPDGWESFLELENGVVISTDDQGVTTATVSGFAGSDKRDGALVVRAGVVARCLDRHRWGPTLDGEWIEVSGEIRYDKSVSSEAFYWPSPDGIFAFRTCEPLIGMKDSHIPSELRELVEGDPAVSTESPNGVRLGEVVAVTGTPITGAHRLAVRSSRVSYLIKCSEIAAWPEEFGRETVVRIVGTLGYRPLLAPSDPKFGLYKIERCIKPAGHTLPWVELDAGKGEVSPATP